ncbi:MAG: extracellular solute-binding protein [Spirochaetales bacterium]|nr:extracellular solute-binding protein [Spirochaetales bacterium]
MRKEVTIKWFLLILVFLLSADFCFPSDRSEGKQKLYKVSVFILTPSQQPTPDNRVFKRIKEEFGIVFDFDIIAGDANQKIGVMLASSDLPDIINAHQRFIDNEAFIPLEGLIEEHAPRIKKHLEQCWSLITHDDGHIYVMPNWGVYQGDYKSNESLGPAFWIQKAVLKEFGYPEVKTLDQYFDLLIKYRERYPTVDGQPTIGFEILCEGWRDFCLKNPPQHLIGFPNDGDVVVRDNKAEMYSDKDYAKRYYKKLNELNQMGLIDREAFVLSYDQYIAKISSGRVLGMFDQKWNFQRAEYSLKKQGKIWRTYAPCPVTYDESIKDYYMDRPVVNVDRGFGISVNCKDPERLIKLFDSLLDEEWQKFLQWGVEGEDYIVNDKGKFIRTQEMRDMQNDPAWKQSHTGLSFFDESTKLEGTFSDGNATSPGIQPEEYFESLKPEDKEFLAGYGYKTFSDFFSPPPPNPPHYPVWSLHIPEGTPGQTAFLKYDDISLKYLPRVILADPKNFENVWAQYMDELEKIDIPAYLDAVNEAIQVRIKKVVNN